MNAGRTNVFQMDIPTAGLPIANKPYLILLKCQKCVDEEIQLLENAGYKSKCLSSWAALKIIVPKKPDPLNPQKQQLHLVLDYQLVNKSINTAHNGNSIISYYPLPNITNLI